ncbi:MAG: cupin domain-containing protein [Alphaproteobacteria bacterium]|nr:cupin domain-containing protein [Alphaproteobacteria bacterium]
MAKSKWDVEHMERERIARFSELKTDPRFFLDSMLPGHERLNYNVIGTGVAENPDAKPAIDYAQDFNLTYMKAAPGKGPSLHSHDHVEVFIPMTGRWSVTWGDDGEYEVILDPFDVISVPIGEMRAIVNVSDSDAWHLTILGGTKPSRVDWHDDVIQRAQQAGFALDEDGNIQEI